MSKLHEVLAVEADKAGIAKRIMDETRGVFQSKHQLFLGAVKTLKMDNDGFDSLEAASSEKQLITTTVPDRLNYTAKAISDWLDVVSQKEHTNQTAAKADLVIGGVVLLTNVPATLLLGLEKKLKLVREIYNTIPTLAQGTDWEDDSSNIPHTFKAGRDEVRAKTQKTNKSRVMYEATKEHPAQIEKWSEETVVGNYTTKYTSGMISSARKMELLSRVDDVIQAVKQARQRANNCQVVKNCNIGTILFNYINK